MNLLKNKYIVLGMLLGTGFTHAQAQPETLRQYLSGKGCDDMVTWDFYCTAGRQSGKWTHIGVPSCWELQGFGTYQYGMRFYGKARPEGIANEKGIYKYEFNLPAEWEGRDIELVFEGSMTDTQVQINGRKAGNIHQGGFYRFSYNVSDRVFFGKTKNRLEVTVSKESENDNVNLAERRADYWNFGGIFRPVFIVSKPVHNINRVAINAQMSGHFSAQCHLNRAYPGATLQVEIMNRQGKVVTTGNQQRVEGDAVTLEVDTPSPLLWTAETPNLYTAVFTLRDATGKTVHREKQKFGFRTIEYRASDGVYINGRKVIFKGVNRHSFRPETGRTLSKAKNIEDVQLIKSMNMNAVRLSHYPADPEFLDACDSLGLYVESELSGWHYAHTTLIGSKLVQEMVTRDVNHPSIIFWSNGNEGGFNYELDGEFGRWDPQKRVVLYPWANRNGFETKHYRSYGETQEYMREKEIFMPTEFLHGLYDGGHGAGLADYWRMMMQNPRCAGGFLWDLSDQAVVRTDMKGMLDCVGNFGADGIVGPHFEKEGSYFTIKQLWSPIQIVPQEPKNLKAGQPLSLRVENHYNFINLAQTQLRCEYWQLPQNAQQKPILLATKTINPGRVEAGKSTEVVLNKIPIEATAVTVKAFDHTGNEVMTWTWPVQTQVQPALNNKGANTPLFTQTNNATTVSVGGTKYVFSNSTGMLTSVETSSSTIPFGNGPRLVAARRSDRSFDQFYNHDDKDAEKKKTQYTLFADQGSFSSFEWLPNASTPTLCVHYAHGSLETVTWQFLPDGSVDLAAQYNFGGVVDLLGIAFDLPEQGVKHKTWVGKGPYRVWQNRMDGPQFGYWENNYNDPIPGESWTYPEFKGYFAGVRWMQLDTQWGHIKIDNGDESQFIGVYRPRDGRDELLYRLPETGISVLKVIPAVRNKVNTTDLNGPSAQPHWVEGRHTIHFKLNFGHS